jgi:hypothetical protein
MKITVHDLSIDETRVINITAQELREEARQHILSCFENIHMNRFYYGESGTLESSDEFGQELNKQLERVSRFLGYE